MNKLQQALNEKDYLKAKRLIIDNPEYLEENVDNLLGNIKYNLGILENIPNPLETVGVLRKTRTELID